MQETYLPDYREYLLRELEGRKVRSPYYSLRAFARDLEISPSSLSEILAGRYGLSRARAMNIGKRLKLSPQQLEHFADLMVLKRTKPSEEKKLAAYRVKFRLQSDKNKVSAEVFRVIADWHHFAILELFYLQGFKADPKWIAKALKIQPATAKTALARLVKVGMLKKTKDGLAIAEDVSFVGEDIPSAAIRIFHKQILEKAGEAIFGQSIDQRELSASILSVQKSDLPQMKRLIRKFVSSMQTKFAGKAKRDAVYCLALQCFSLTDTKLGAEDESSTIVH